MRIEKELKCPKCDGKEFQRGPEGGNSINIKFEVLYDLVYYLDNQLRGVFEYH